MAFGQDFLKAFFGNDYLKDYTHASKIFRSDGYANSPRFKYLFHVYFNLNTAQIPALRNVFSTPETSTIGLLIKTIDLPKFSLDTEVLNQYNRKRIIQKKIQYQPVTMRFHDDQGDLIRTMWYNYYSYYYKDPSQKYQNVAPTQGTLGTSATLSNGFDYNGRDIYAANRQVNDWGYIGEAYNDGTQNKPPFFADITIYGLNQHKWNSYVLINPMIKEWSHDTYDYNQDAGVMENTMTIEYETVKYYSGAVGEVKAGSSPVQGFGSSGTYDQSQSPLSRPGGTRSIIGQGGLLDAGIGIISDLQNPSLGSVIGAVQKAGTVYNTFKGANLRAVVNQTATDAVQGVLRTGIQGTPGALQTTGGIGLDSLTSVLRRPIFPTPPKG